MFEFIAEPPVSKHLCLLRKAGFVEPLVDAWLAPFRRFCSGHMDALERHLDSIDHHHQRKGKQGKVDAAHNRQRDKGETK